MTDEDASPVSAYPIDSEVARQRIRDALPLGNNISNALNYRGIRTVGDLVTSDLTWGALLKIKGIGPYRIVQIHLALKALGFGLRPWVVELRQEPHPPRHLIWELEDCAWYPEIVQYIQNRTTTHGGEHA